MPPTTIEYKSHLETEDTLVVVDASGTSHSFLKDEIVYRAAEGDGGCNARLGCIGYDKPGKEGRGKWEVAVVGGGCLAEANHHGPRNVVAVVNPNSGTGKSAAMWKVVEEWLEKGSIPHEVYYTERPLHAVELILELSGKGKLGPGTTLVAVGGDGILHEITNGLHQSTLKTEEYPVLSIVPTGTGNGLASTLGIRNFEDSIYALMKGEVVGMDGLLFRQENPRDRSTGEGVVGAVKERMGFLHLTYGIIADIDFDSEWLRVLGAARFPITAVGKILMLPKYRAKLKMEVKKLDGTLEDVTIEDDFLSIQLSNVPEISKNMTTNPSATISDGLLDVAVILHSQITRYNAYRLFTLVESDPQSLLTMPWMHFYKATKATLTPLAACPSYGKLDFDGEWMPYGEVTLTPSPSLFKVMKPKS